MKRKKICKILSAMFAITMGLGVATACSDKDKTGLSEEKVGFIEGYAQKVEYGESLLLSEYIDFSLGDEYTLVAKKGDEEIDITSETLWTPTEPGDWKLIYTVLSGSNKGSYTADIKIYHSSLSWTYTLQPMNVELGSTLQFEDFYESLNLTTSSYYEPQCFMDKVRFDDQEVDLDGKTEYTFTSFAKHYFTFGVKTEDGQQRKAIATIDVCKTDESAAAYFEENDMLIYGHKLLNADLSVELKAGTYQGSVGNAKNSDIPYVAYRGNFGINSYVKMDFTGNNLPKIAFFCDSITPQIIDKKKGLYISNGTVSNTGKPTDEYTISAATGFSKDWSRFTVYGPNKIANGWIDSNDRFLIKGENYNPHPISRSALKDNVKYRYIVGFSDFVPTSQDTSAYGGQITLNVLLINLDEKEIVADYSYTMGCKEGYVGETPVFADNYCSGSIVCYGSYGVGTNWDKLYPVYENVESIYDLDEIKPTKKLKDVNFSYALNESLTAELEVAPKKAYVNNVEVPFTTTGTDITLNRSVFANFLEQTVKVDIFTDEWKMQFNVTVLPGLLVYSGSKTTGSVEMLVDGTVSSVKIENNALAFTQTGNKISIEKSVFQNYAGHKELTIQTDKGVQTIKTEVIGPVIEFTDGQLSSAIMVEGGVATIEAQTYVPQGQTETVTKNAMKITVGAGETCRIKFSLEYLAFAFQYTDKDVLRAYFTPNDLPNTNGWFIFDRVQADGKVTVDETSTGGKDNREEMYSTAATRRRIIASKAAVEARLAEDKVSYCEIIFVNREDREVSFSFNEIGTTVNWNW